MEGYELKKLSDVPVTDVTEGTKQLVEQDGEIKKIDKGQVSDAKAVKKVNGVGPDENGNVEVEVPEGFSGSYNDLTDKPFETLNMCPIAFLKGNTEEILSFDDSYGEAENFPNSISAGVEYQVTLLINPSSSNVKEIQVTATAYQHEFDLSRICIKLSDFFTLEYRKSQGFIVDGDDYYYEGEPCTMSIYRAEQVKKLDEKYLPDTVAKKEDMFSGSWNDLQDRPFYSNITIADGAVPVFGPYVVTPDSDTSVEFYAKEYADAELVTVVGDDVTPLQYTSSTGDTNEYCLQNKYVRFAEITSGGITTFKEVRSLHQTEPFTVMVYHASDVTQDLKQIDAKFIPESSTEPVLGFHIRKMFDDVTLECNVDFETASNLLSRQVIPTFLDLTGGGRMPILKYSPGVNFHRFWVPMEGDITSLTCYYMLPDGTFTTTAP